MCDPYINLENFASEIASLEDADGQGVTLERALRGKPCYLVVRKKVLIVCLFVWQAMLSGGKNEGFGFRLFVGVFFGRH